MDQPDPKKVVEVSTKFLKELYEFTYKFAKENDLTPVEMLATFPISYSQHIVSWILTLIEPKDIPKTIDGINELMKKIMDRTHELCKEKINDPMFKILNQLMKDI